MTTSVDELKATMATMATQLSDVQEMTKQFAGFQSLMSTPLDKLGDQEAWRTIAETSMGSMIQQSKETSNRVQQLESRPPLPQPPPPLPLAQTALLPLHQPGAPPRQFAMTAGVDLNTAPAASSSQSPNRHGLRFDHRVAGDGILGSLPPHPVTGMLPNP